MSKRACFCAFSYLLSVLLLFSACAPKSGGAPLGVWKDESGEIVLQFASDSSFTMGISGYKAEGSYRMNGSKIEISLDTNELGLEDRFTWDYRLESGALTLTKDDISSVFHPLEGYSPESSAAGE